MFRMVTHGLRASLSMVYEHYPPVMPIVYCPDVQVLVVHVMMIFAIPALRETYRPHSTTLT